MHTPHSATLRQVGLHATQVVERDRRLEAHLADKKAMQAHIDALMQVLAQLIRPLDSHPWKVNYIVILPCSLYVINLVSKCPVLSKLHLCNKASLAGRVARLEGRDEGHALQEKKAGAMRDKFRNAELERLRSERGLSGLSDAAVQNHNEHKNTELQQAHASVAAREVWVAAAYFPNGLPSQSDPESVPA